MGRRTILLIAALVVAALGTALVWMYANRAEDAALAGQEPVEVLVATVGISSGTSGAAISEAASAELRKLPAASVPPGALSDLTPVTDQVTVASIFPGQVLIQPMFGSPGQASGGLTLPAGTMGVAVSLEDPQRVAGFVQPGSEVAVFVTVAGARTDELETAMLLDRALVVAVGPTTISTSTTTTESQTNTEEIPRAILTLALNQENAQRLIHAAETGRIYFTLLGAESEVDAGTPGTTTANLLD